jgi:hypothetical protein
VVEEPVVETPAEEVTEPAGEVEPAEGCAEPSAEPTVEPEGCADQPSGCAEEPVGETTAPGAAETATGTAEPVVTEPTETATGTAEPVDVTEPAEVPADQPGATHEGCAEATGEGACGGEVPEGCAEAAGEGSLGEVPTETAGVALDEPLAWQGDERVVWVSGQMIRLPRLPFFGAEDVTDDDLRAIIEEVLLNPETDE